MSEDESEEFVQPEIDPSVWQVCGNGICIRTTVVEAKLDEGIIQEAESALCEGLSLNFEEARALLGRLECQRGNIKGALRVFDGIDLQAATQRTQRLTKMPPSGEGESRFDSIHAVSQHAASRVLESMYLKGKSLQKLGRVNEIHFAGIL